MNPPFAGFCPILSAMNPLARLSLRAVFKEINEPIQIGAPCRTVVTWRAMLSRLQKELFELLNFWIKCLGHTGDAAEGHTPNNPSNHVDDFFSRHMQGVNFLFADGSVRNINNTIKGAVWEALGTRAGGEAIDDSDL